MRKTNHDNKEKESEQRRLTKEKGASLFLGIPVGSLKQDRHTGAWGIPFIKIGRSVRYDLRDLEAFIESHRVEPED